MDKKQLVELIINSDANTFSADDTDTLMSMPVEVLAKMVENKKADPAAADMADDEEEEVPAEDPKKKPVKNASVEEYLNNNADMPDDVKAVILNGQKVLKAQKDKYIKIITANKKNTFKPEMLAKKDIDELASLAQLAAGTEEKKADFSANGDLNDEITDNAHIETALELPTMNFAEKKD